MTNSQQDARDRAEAAFERVWDNFRLDKARLRSINEKDKAELKSIMKTIFLSSMAVGEAPKEIKVEVQGGGADKEEVESSVRRILKEELGGMTGLLEQIRDKEPSVVHVSGGVVKDPEQSKKDAEIVLHGAIFDSDMKTNIDEVALEENDVESVKGNLDALRKLRGDVGGDAENE